MISMQSSIRLFILLCFAFSTFLQGERKNNCSIILEKELVFAICVNNNADVKKAELLLKSINQFGGKYSKNKFYVVYRDLKGINFEVLRKYNAEFLPLQIDNAAIDYPFGHKAYACAQVEKKVAEQNCELVWLDNESIVLAQPDELILNPTKQCAFRPVFLLNSIGQELSKEPDQFWSKIYKETNLDPSKVPTVETFVENKKIRFYINCQVITVNPKLGIFTEWQKIFSNLIKDVEFQKAACNDVLHQIFLHQAVLSAVIASKIKSEEFQLFSNNYGYPIHQNDKLPSDKKLSVNDVKILLYENIFTVKPNWLDDYNVKNPLKEWIIKNHSETYKVVENIYRLEGLCNSYLIKTKAGNIIVDPGGASNPNNWLQKVNGNKSVKSILITHGHEDHVAGIDLWKGKNEIPVVAQREIVNVVKLQDMFAKLSTVRVAKQRGQQIPKVFPENEETRLSVNKLFVDNYTYKLGGLTFKMIHTGGESPDNSVIWIPELKAFFIGDNYYTSFPNIYTLRGTTPRWPLEYIKALELGINYQPDVLLPGHGEPILGKENIISALSAYRDAIKFVHDETVKGINDGKDVFTLMKEIKLPEKYKSYFSESYGKVSWTVRGIYNYYIGWFDENISNMFDEPSYSIYPLITEMTGKDAIIKKTNEMLQGDEAVKALHMTDLILLNEPKDKSALETRLKAVDNLRIKSSNWIEFNWLNSEQKKIKNLLSSSADQE